MAPAALPWWRVFVPLIAFIGLGLVCRWRDVRLLQPIWSMCLVFVGYGIIQDQLSVRLCLEYFTIGHPPIQGVTNPTFLGVIWGFLGGFPGGIAAGIPLTLSMHVGNKAPFPLQKLKPLMAIVFAGVAFGTLVSGLSGWYNTTIVNISLGEPWNNIIPSDNHHRFFIVALMHFGTYLSAGILIVGIGVFIIHQRIKRHAE